jgi:hypothetical protein
VGVLAKDTLYGLRVEKHFPYIISHFSFSIWLAAEGLEAFKY